MREGSKGGEGGLIEGEIHDNFGRYLIELLAVVYIMTSIYTL